MADNLNSTAANLVEILSDTSEFKDPIFAQTADALMRFVQAGESLSTKARAAAKTGLALNELVDEAHEKASDEKNPRARDLKKAWDQLIAFLAASQMLADGGTPSQFKACGDTMQGVLDKIEFSDKKQIADLRKKALAFYPAESALLKEADAWSVRANQVVEQIKKAIAKLDLTDGVQKVHANGLAKFAKKAADAAKVVKG